MCGITGIYNYGNDKPIEKGILQKMCDVIRHRGPDSEGIFLRNSVGLGIRRLAIIDLQTGNQPIHNEDNTLWIVLNGEIYNFIELKKDLSKNHSFYTKTDTEVILHLYEQYGEKCVEHLRGMFAFAIWDEKNKKIFIAKDRVGKKPLYYTLINGSFVFASEIKSILEYIKKTPETDLEAIDLYLTYQYIPSPKTIFKNIKSLLPAHTLTCDKNGNIKTEKYWDLDFIKKTDLSFAEACKKTESLLTEATDLRMISDVPLGAFLSGGHDSSIIVGLMSKLSKQPVKTFSIGFDESEFSELKYAKIAANHFKTDHHEFIVKANFIDILPRLVWHYGQPYADSSALPSYFVSNETRKHVTVALNGDGGDETFGGYLRYKAMKGSLYLSIPFRLLGKKMTKNIASFIFGSKSANETKYLRYMNRLISALSDPPELRNLQWHYYFSNEAKNILYTDKMKQNFNSNPYDYLLNIFRNSPAKNIMDRTFYTDIKSYLPECLLVKMDIASMSNSLETRSPFLDHKVMEFSASLPPAWKIRCLTTKYILKKTFKDLLPKEILYRGKMGFGIPVGKWFRNDWKGQFRDIVLSQKAISRGYFKKESLEQIFDEHINGKREHGYRMWALLMLELWHMVYIDKSIKIS